MKNLFFPPFYSGQKVIYVGDPCAEVKNNKVYTVKDCKMSACGCWCVDVANIVHSIFNFVTECGCCGKVKNSTFGYAPKISNGEVEGVYWFSSRDFRPAEEVKAKIMTFEKISQVEEKEVLVMN